MAAVMDLPLHDTTWSVYFDGELHKFLDGLPKMAQASAAAHLSHILRRHVAHAACSACMVHDMWTVLQIASQPAVL